MTPEDYQRAVEAAGEACSLEDALTFMRCGYLPETAAYALARRGNPPLRPSGRPPA